MGMTKDELIHQKQLLEALARKCKSDGLYIQVAAGLRVINREIGLRELEFSSVNKSINKESNKNV